MCRIKISTCLLIHNVTGEACLPAEQSKTFDQQLFCMYFFIEQIYSQESQNIHKKSYDL